MVPRRRGPRVSLVSNYLDNCPSIHYQGSPQARKASCVCLDRFGAIFGSSTEASLEPQRLSRRSPPILFYFRQPRLNLYAEMYNPWPPCACWACGLVFTSTACAPWFWVALGGPSRIPPASSIFPKTIFGGGMSRTGLDYNLTFQEG